MKKKTYRILSTIPFVNIIISLICKPVMFCSPGISDGAYDDLLSYMKDNPDILMTETLAKKIRRG